MALRKASWAMGGGGKVHAHIIEPVDSNVGIAQTRNIWQYTKISPNLKNGELISLYDNILFIFECFNDQQDSMVRKSITKVPNQTAAKQPNCSSLLLLSWDGLAQYCVNLSRWFTHETAAFLLSSARPHCFFTTSKSRM